MSWLEDRQKMFEKAKLQLPAEEYERQRDTRNRGTTTAMAFGFISKAMLSPETAVRIHDHVNTIAAQRHIVTAIRFIIEDMGLEGLSFSKDRQYLTFSLRVPKKQEPITDTETMKILLEEVIAIAKSRKLTRDYSDDDKKMDDIMKRIR